MSKLMPETKSKTALVDALLSTADEALGWKLSSADRAAVRASLEMAHEMAVLIDAFELAEDALELAPQFRPE